MSKTMMAGFLAFALIAAAGGYWAGSRKAPPQPIPEKGPVAFYRNPMVPSDTSPVPKKDSMGMDYVPVMRDVAAADDGAVVVSPGRLQTLGVRTAPVETRAGLSRTVNATATVQFDERHLAAVTTKSDGWVEKLEVAATGDMVRRGQVVAWFYSPDVVAAEREYLVAAGLAGHEAHADKDLLAAASLQRLRSLDVPEEEIARLGASGQASRRIAVRAAADGVVIEKLAVEGMRVAAGDPLYRTADLSTVWLIAEIQESELGRIARGNQVTASFAAFPGRSFAGMVDFVYPAMNPQTRTARVRILVPNSDLSLRADMFASAAIESSPPAQGEAMIVIPDSAVIDSGPRQYVLVEEGEGRFLPRTVRLGARGDGAVQVLEGVSAGERVVVAANFLIDAESNLRSALQAFAARAEIR